MKKRHLNKKYQRFTKTYSQIYLTMNVQSLKYKSVAKCQRKSLNILISINISEVILKSVFSTLLNKNLNLLKLQWYTLVKSSAQGISKITCGTLSKLFNPCMPQFPHLKNKNKNNTYYTKLCGLNEMMQLNSIRLNTQ